MLARMPTLPVKRVAWLLPRALVHAGEAGFERIDAGGQPLKGGQQFPVVGVQLFQDGQVVGVEALPGREHLRAELRLADQLRLGCLGAEELLQEEQPRADRADGRRPALARDAARGRDWGLEVCVHGDWILVTGSLLLVTCYWSLVTDFGP